MAPNKGRHICSICKAARFKTKGGLLSHMLNLHTNDVVYCSNCQCACVDNNHYEQHMKSKPQCQITTMDTASTLQDIDNDFFAKNNMLEMESVINVEQQLPYYQEYNKSHMPINHSTYVAHQFNLFESKNTNNNSIVFEKNTMESNLTNNQCEHNASTSVFQTPNFNFNDEGYFEDLESYVHSVTNSDYRCGNEINIDNQQSSSSQQSSSRTNNNATATNQPQFDYYNLDPFPNRNQCCYQSFQKDKKIHSEYIYRRCQMNKTSFENEMYDNTDFAMVELYCLLRKSRAPMGLFDTILKWLNRNQNSFNDSQYKFPSCKSFVKKTYSTLHGRYQSKGKPKNVDVSLESITSMKHNIPKSIKTTIIDFREVLIDMLSNSDIMNPKNLLFYDPLRPNLIHPFKTKIGEPVTSDVFRRAYTRLCKNKDKDVLWPMALYNDEINFDRNGHLQLDPWSVCFLRNPLHIRNQALAWRYFGFVHSLDPKVLGSKDIDTYTKMNIYQLVLKEIFHQMDEIQQEGGIKWDLELSDGSTKKCNLIIYPQFIIGDTKGHDSICGRYASHNSRQCVRDCDVLKSQSDLTSHKCHYRTVQEMMNMNSSDLKQQSFHVVNKVFLLLMEMGDNVHGLYGALPVEMLHMFFSGLDEYESKDFLNGLTKKKRDFINNCCINIVSNIDKQSSKHLVPDRLNGLRNGLENIKSLTGKEKHARLFLHLLCLLGTDVINQLTKLDRSENNEDVPRENNEDESSIHQSKKKKPNERKQRVTIELLNQWSDLFTESLMLIEWMKQSEFDKEDLYNEEWLSRFEIAIDNEEDLKKFDIDSISDDMTNGSKAQIRIIKFMKKYKDLVTNDNKGLQFPKFHFLLHIIRTICRHGSPIHYDGSRQESNASYMGKISGLRTQKNHKSLCIQTAARYHEDLQVLELQRRMHNLVKSNSQSFVDDKYTYFGSAKISIEKDTCSNLYEGNTDALDEDMDTCSTLNEEGGEVGSLNNDNVDGTFMEVDTDRASKFKIRLQNNNTVRIIWNNKPPLAGYDPSLLKQLANWLWTDPRGGFIDREDSNSGDVVGFTECNINGQIYRAHPSFRGEEAWFDWAYFKWEGFERNIPGRILLMFDIEACTLTTERDARKNHSDTRTHLVDNERVPAYLDSSTKWVVIQSAITHEQADWTGNSTNLSYEYYLQSPIAKRFSLEDKFRVVPLEAIVGPCFVMMDNAASNTLSKDVSVPIKKSLECVLIESIDKWPSLFLA